MPGTDEIQGGVSRSQPPTSMTPARCPWETSTLPGIRSPWVITSPALRGSARMTAQMRRSRGTSRSCSLRSKQVSIHGSWDRSSPPDPSVERPAARVDCTHAADEFGQVVRKHDRFARVLVCRRSSRQPGLHRPWKRVTRSGFAECDRLGRQEPSASQQLAGCLRLGFEPPPRRCDVPRF